MRAVLRSNLGQNKVVRHRRRRLFRWSMVLGLIMFIALLPVALIKPAAPAWAPEPLRNYAFDMRLALGVPMKSVSSIMEGTLGGRDVYRDTAGRAITFESGDITIAGTLYEPTQAAKRPAIVLTHGSTPEGRHLGLYRVLGRELATRGYIVLAIDVRGFGESEDPATVTQPEALDYVSDVLSAVTYLGTLDSVDTDQMYVVGHSFGGDVAISAGVTDERIKKIVAFGPGRRFTERGGTPDAPEFAYFVRREMRYRLISEEIPPEIFLQTRAKLPIENHMAYFEQPGHKPLLLLDGATESAEDREFLRQTYAEMAEPKAYVTLPNADHYANVANLGSLIIYEPEVAAQLVSEIDTWLSAE